MRGIEIDLDGCSALVTGAGQGVGLAIANGLARCGARVWVNDLDGTRANDAAASIVTAGGDVRAVVADVTDADAVASMVATTGPIDILVNNAGIPASGMSLGTFLDSTPDDWRPSRSLNYDAVLHVTHAYLRPMTERGWGRVLTIVSDAGRRGEPGQVIYGSAKAAAMGFSRGLAMEVARHGVTVNCIALGAIRHGLVATFFDASPEAEQKATKAYPLRRLGTPDDPAALAVLLCSDAGSWITGQVYPVDGGYTQAL